MKSRLLVSIILAVFALILGAAAAYAADEPVGRVSVVKGSATVVHAGSATPARLTANSPVFAKDRINTGGRSKVKMVMNDESVVTLGPDAEMVVTEFVYTPGTNTRKSSLQLVKGAVRSFISKFFTGIGSNFEVHTPTAVAGARGTHNLVQVMSGSRTLVVGISSITSVSNSDPSITGEEILTDNHGSYVDLGQPPTPPFIVPDTLLSPLMEQTEAREEDQSSGGEAEGGLDDADTSGDEGFAPPADDQPVTDNTPVVDPTVLQDINSDPTIAAAATPAWTGGYLARIPSDTGYLAAPGYRGVTVITMGGPEIWHNSATDAVLANSPDAGTNYNFALNAANYPAGLFGVDTSGATPTTDMYGNPYSYIWDITGGNDVFGHDMAYYSGTSWVEHEPNKDFFFFGLTEDTRDWGGYWNYLDDPYNASVIGYLGYSTPPANLPTSGTYLYDNLIFAASPYDGTIKPFEPPTSVNWQTGKVYGISNYDYYYCNPYNNDVAIFIGSVDRTTSKINGNLTIKTGRYWEGYYDTYGDYTPRSATGDESLQLFGADEPVAFGGTSDIYAFDESINPAVSSGINVGWLGLRDAPYLDTSIAEGETWNGFASGFVYGRQNGELWTAYNTDPLDVAMTFYPSTGTFAGAINTWYGEGAPVGVTTYTCDPNAYISPNAFGAVKTINGTPAYIASVPVEADYYDDYYDYTTWGVWSVDTNDWTNASAMCQSPWIAGRLTPDVCIPTTGYANYAGEVHGLLTEYGGNPVVLTGNTYLTADFANMRLTGSFDNLTRSDGSTWISYAPVDASWNGTNSIHGSVYTNDEQHYGNVNGAFFGPNAEEVGGNWTLSGAVDTAAGIFRGSQRQGGY